MKAEFFYSYDGLVASTDLGGIQLAFDMLTGIFDRVSLQMNVRKNVRVVFRTCRASRVWLDEAYTQKMTG